jgi:sugar lactone lactonase YvrE
MTESGTASLMASRHSAASPTTSDGWRLERLTAPSRLFGANGLRTGPDGRVYVAQVTGSQISALDLETGRLDNVSAKGGDIIAPDDVAFDPSGNLYATEVMDGRVSVLEAGGRTRVLRDDLPCANGITVHQGGSSSTSVAMADGFWSSMAPEPSCASWPRTYRRPTPWRSVPTGCSITR